MLTDTKGGAKPKSDLEKKRSNLRECLDSSVFCHDERRQTLLCYGVRKRMEAVTDLIKTETETRGSSLRPEIDICMWGQCLGQVYGLDQAP